MNVNTYLHWLSELQSRDLLLETPTIEACLHGNVLSPESISKEPISVRYSLVSIPLQDKSCLLVKDLPQNFFLAYTILLGEDTSLVSAQLKEDKSSRYIMELKTFRDHKDLFDRGTCSTVDTETIRGQKFSLPFRSTPLLEELSNYLEKENGINLRQIHLVQGSGISLFLPTIRRPHLRMAISLSIPVMSLIDEHHYIRDTTIHLYDFNRQTEYLSPLATEESTLEWPIVSKSRNHAYHDIATIYRVNLPQDTCRKQLQAIPTHNIDRADIDEIIQWRPNFDLSSHSGNIPLFIWRSKQTHSFFPIDSEESFFNYTGIRFSPRYEDLRQTLIQNAQGEDLEIKPRYLHPKLETFSENSPFKTAITFNNTQELLLQLALNPHDMVSITFVPSLHKGKYQEFLHLCDHLLSQLIIHSISLNRFPYHPQTKDILTRYYSAQTQELKSALRSHYHTPNLQRLLNSILPLMKSLRQVSKHIRHKEHHLFGLWQNWLLVWSIIQVFDNKKADAYREKVKTYFPNLGWELTYLREKPIQQSVMDTIAHANRLSRKRSVLLYTISEEDPSEFLSNEVRVTDTEPNKKTYRTPNKSQIREHFPKSAGLMIEKIRQYADTSTPLPTLFPSKEHSLSTYIFIKTVYPDHKCIMNSPLWSLLLPREQPTSPLQDNTSDTDTFEQPNAQNPSTDD